MDVHLKTLADASLEVADAHTALEEDAFHTASERLDAAGLLLTALREAWLAMSPAERAVLGPGATEVRRDLDAARSRIPRLSALSIGVAVSDPEEEQAPG